MPAYDFLSGVASAVEKQSNALQAYGLQKREQEREQQERTQYNQVFTELGQFLASGQEIPEERIQTWTSMMGAAPPEIVTAFTNAMNTLGNRREEQQYRTVQTGIAQEGLNLQRQQLRQGASEFDRRLADAVAERTWRSGEAELDRALQRQIAGMQMSNRQMEETFNRVKMLQAQYAYAEDDNTKKAIEQQINEALGINVSGKTGGGSGAFTPEIANQYITQAKNNLGLRANPYTTRIELERMARAEQDPTKRSHIRLSINEIPLPDTNTPADTSTADTNNNRNVAINTLSRQIDNLTNEYNRLGNPFSKNGRALKEEIDNLTWQLRPLSERRASEIATRRESSADAATRAYIESIKNR